MHYLAFRYWYDFVTLRMHNLLISLTFVETTAKITKKLSEIRAKEKETATFVCEMSEANLKPIWMKGGQKLSADKKYDIVTDKKVQKLIIRNVTMKDKGEYTCIYRDISTWAKLNVRGEFVYN